MRLIPNWKRVLKRSWSVWCAVAAGVLGSIEAVLPLFQESIPRGPFAALTVVAAVLAVVARLIEQRSLHDGN